MSACSARGNGSRSSVSQTSESSNPALSVSGEISASSAVSDIPAADYPKYYDKYIEPLKLSKILLHDWNSLTDILEQFPEFQTIGFLVQGILGQEGWIAVYDEYYDEDEMSVYIPQELAETTVMQYFDISIAELRQHLYYNADKKAYKYRLPMDDGIEVEILSIEENGNQIILHCEHGSGGPDVCKNDLIILLSDDGFKFVSNIVN